MNVYTNIRALAWIIAIGGFYFPSTAQSKITFGEATLDELKMTIYERDSTASAAVLFDIGKFNGNETRFTRHMRVKILKKSGLDWGNWVFSTPSKSDFKVVVSNLVDGEIVKEKADKGAIFEEEVVDNTQVYKVFAPNVRSGSVIDIFYSFRGFPLEWRFQDRIPVVLSDLTLEESRYIKFSKSSYGFERIQTISPIRWKAVDMPAFTLEPFLNNYQNYITKFEFQLQSMMYSGKLIEFSTTWEKVIEVLDESPMFGLVTRSASFLSDKGDEIKKKDIPDEQKIKEAYGYIRDNIKWNGIKSLVTPRYELKNHFQVTHSGNSAEINLLLIYLLNRAGITTYPVVLSTRDHGLVNQASPTLNKLNYVIAYVEHDKTLMYLDATSDHLTPGILPYYCLNGDGLLIAKRRLQWLSLNTKFFDSKRQLVEVTLGEDGSAVARVTQDFQNYAFISWMDDLKANNHDREIMKDKYQKTNSEIKIDQYEIRKKDINALAGQEYFEIDIANNLVDAGNELMFNPFVLFEYSQNPFKSEQRKYPVDFAHAKDFVTTEFIQLPKGYTLKELPPSAKVTTPDGGAVFTFMANSAGSKIQIRAVLRLTKAIFTEIEYLELRHFFSEVIKIINTPIQLNKQT